MRKIHNIIYITAHYWPYQNLEGAYKALGGGLMDSNAGPPCCT